MERLKRILLRPDSDAPAIAAWIGSNRDRLPSPYLFELARRTFATDRDASLTWFALGTIRARYAAIRCTDRTARPYVGYLPRIATARRRPPGFAIPARGGRQEDQKQGAEAGTITRECAPVDSVIENPALYEPSKAGLIRIVYVRDTFHGRKPGGIYLTGPDGKTVRIFAGAVDTAAASPNGCHLAFRETGFAGRQWRRVVKVLTLC